MEQIRATVQALLKELKSGKKNTGRKDPQQLAKKLFSARERRHLEVVACRNGVLSVKVDSASWLYYLNLKKRQLLAKFVQDSPKAKDIRFAIGEISAGKQT
jgi:predicted nucleic acid-binding Zn ribbon protein